MVLAKLSVLGRPNFLIIVGQEPTALAEGADLHCLHVFSSPEPKALGEFIV